MRERELSDTLEDQREAGSSSAILEAIQDAEKAFDPYMAYCRTVDKVYSLTLSSANLQSYDETFALFWASMEILKPAIYAKPPKPVASPRFKDGGKLEKTTAELIERCLESAFDRGGIDEVMLGVRDDLALTNRGVAWVTYETDEKGGGQRICLEHLDRADFLHEPARKWSEVGWVARRAWMTLTEMEKRFTGKTREELEAANFTDRKDKADQYGMHDSSAKAGVWEVWSKADNKVYWVTEGVRTVLDEDKPHLDLFGFFPCPRPAYGTLQRRSLVPVPDYKRYQYHLDQINSLTERIYVLLEKVKLKVLIPAGGEVSDAVQTALDSSDDSFTISVPAAALSASNGNLFITLPLAEVATAIQGLIEARSQLISDFYQLSGISDIMRGATEAQETLGAQQLKSQYGSVRVRDKIDELQRLARDLAAISAEIMAANFSKKTLLDLSQMKIADKSALEKEIKAIPGKAEDEVKALRNDIEDQAEAQPGEVDPEQVQQAFMQGKAAIVQKYDVMLQQLTAQVPMDDVMELLRDSHGRGLSIEIETDSTVLTDEMAEKQSRAEFLNAFANAKLSVAEMLAAGESGAKLAGGILKFALQPYRASRELDALIDEFVENVPPAPQGAPDGQEELIAAQNKLAEAEIMKAQAQTQKVSADAQGKMQELQLRGAEAQAKAQADQQRLMLELEASKAAQAETAARIEKIFAEIEAMGIKTQVDVAKVGIEQKREQREDVKTAADISMRQTDQAMSAQDRERNAQLSERQQSFSEQQGDRQLTLAEKQAMERKEPAQ